MTAAEAKIEEVRESNNNSNLPELRRLNKLIVNYESLLGVKYDLHCECMEHELEKEGTALTFGVYKDLNVSMVRTFLSKGTELPMHYHDQRVTLGVIEGSVEITYEDANVPIILRKYEVMDILPKLPHKKVALEDTWIWEVAMPPIQGLPDGPK